MGVPKFYRWVSERYPCLSQVVQEHQIPEFDNMYLDMNGIIHPCSHPNDDDPHFRITEEQIFRNIFHYIEILFQIIKPKKVFFMAVDGVAPRAKMNQQRGRRFRSAKEAEDNIRRALEKGQVLPKEERFDSNCITPGTGFMTRLQEQLKYFVNEKITNDPAWRGLRVYLSGHQTPGEGEHKIMEFIRTERSKPDYDPNTRHCLYGLDADLMMLGLSSHDPHFSLLREEVRFGKTGKRIEKPENITFHLLHLSLFREYLDWEFHVLKNSLSFQYDLERIIDDWILMGFLVGNDFIPHLPHLHINHNALPMLYRVYREVLPTLDGYLHDGGVLNLERFGKYLAALSKLDREKFDEVFVDMKWFEAKTKHGFDKKPGKSRHKNNKTKGSEANSFAALDSLSVKLEQTKLDNDEEMSPELAKLAAASALDDDGEEDSEARQQDVFEIEFAMFKKQYYREKFDIESISSDQLAHFVWEYVRGIQWILHYYFNGVQSWGWYYPYHYAPFLSDLTDFAHHQFVFDMGNPFLPFEQLLAVLPAASKQLLPAPLQNLMIMEESPIIEYYPLNFKTDLNGKQQEWEAVVLIPFIDQKDLLGAMQPLYPRLTKEEAKRNTHGPFLLYSYDSELSFTCPSSLPGSFPDIQLCQAKCEEFDRQVLVTPKEKLTKGLCDNVHLDVYFPGFPTLHHIHHTAALIKANVKVFQMHSRWESMILQLSPKEDKDTHRIAEDLLDEICYVGWPHMVEAKVTSVSDNTFRYTVSRDKPKTKDDTKNIDQKVLTDQMLGIFNKQISGYKHVQLERRGIEAGDVDILIEACPIQGRRFLCGAKGQVTLEKEWSTVPKPYAYQSIAKDIFVHESHSESNIQSIEQLFPISSPCFMLAAPHYGAQGEVLEVDANQGRVRVQLKVPTEPSFAAIIVQKESLSDPYIPAHVLSQKLGVSNSLLGKITAKFLIERGSREKSKGQGQSKLDIGLNIKHSKHNKELLGYAKRTEQGSWSFSPAAQRVIMEYTRKFPKLFDIVAVLESLYDQIYESDLLTRDISESMLQGVQEWLKSLPLAKQEPMTCGSDVLDDQILTEIEKVVQDTKKSSNTKAVKVRVRPYLLFKPSDYLGNILPDSDAEFQLFDRVINVKLNSAVPFGLRGTIIGFHEDQDGEEMVEVMYDESFVGNQPIRRTSKSIYLVRPSSFIDLSYGERREAKKRGQPVPPPRALNKTFAAALSESKRNGSPHRDKKTSSGSPRTGRRGPHGSSMDSSPFPNSKATKNTASPVVTRIATPPGRAASSQSNKDTKDRNDGRRETAPRFMKNNTATPQGGGTNSSEFASMWKELQMKETSPPKDEAETHDENPKNNVSSAKSEAIITADSQEKNPDSVSKERTQALCELLHIGHHSPSTDDQSTPAENQNKGTTTETQEPKQQVTGKHLSVEELFQTQVPVPQPRFPVHGTPGPLPSQILLNYALSQGQSPPRFHYGQGPQGIFATVELANGHKYSGSQSRDHVEATESACAVAVSVLNRISHSMPVQRMPAQPFITSPLMPPFPFPLQPAPTLSMMRAFYPGQRLTMPGHVEPRAGPAGTGSSSLKDKSLRPNASPFIPLQVTRRSVPSKPESPSNPPQDKTTPESKEDVTPATSEPLLTNDISPKKDEPTQKTPPPPPQPISPQVLIPPSSFIDSKAKANSVEGPKEGGILSVTSTGLPQAVDQKSPPHGPNDSSKESTKVSPKSEELNHISEGSKDVPKASTSDDSKKPRPGSAKKPVKKSQRTMAANFSQKK